MHINANKHTLRALIASIAAAFFGVQKKVNHTRDFSEGKPIHFIAGGLIATVLFIIVLAGLVKLILSYAL
ncbi:DUF2970 domain-containing protein [Candidatus Sororendozoicomonas aggregata]|uniref:DUF2970 domain-containing protein n=1 Tax=Candidatus Sororendozoicomonas aggregata TaxID=3073239 RepID=UPI002ED01B7E